MLPILTRFLTPLEYGIVAMFQVLVGIVGIFSGLATHGAISRQYYERETINISKYITNCFYIWIVSSLFIGLVFYLFSEWISHFTDFPAEWLWAVLVVSAGQFIVSVVLILWQVQIKPIPYGTFQILLTLINVGLSLWFIVGFGMGWQGRVDGQVLAYLIFASLGLFILWKNGWLNKWTYESDYVKHALGFSLPLLPHSLGMWAIVMTDRILITNMVGVADTGVYVVGTQIGMIIGLLQHSFNQAWVPWLFSQLKKEDETIKLKIVKITYLYDILIFIAAILLVWISPWLLDFFVGNDFSGANDYVLWIALGYAFNGMYKMVTNYIFYAQKTAYLAAMTFLTAIVNIGLSYLLIRINGTVGAAQGTMLAFLLSFILTWIIANKTYKMPWLGNKA
jgi:O-antigen/teichoic acid export membrane protein